MTSCSSCVYNREMKRKKQSTTPKSLKTFYVYSLLVLIVICIALLLRAFVLFQQSKFETNHHFTFAILDTGSVEEVVAVSPQTSSVTIMQIQDERIPYTTLAKDYGIATDGFLESNGQFSVGEDLATVLWEAVRNNHKVSTDMTIFDFLQLLLVMKNVTTSNTTTTELTLEENKVQNNTAIARALTDPTLASESISIQIVNTTKVGGLGQRLGRVLTNKGANVVDVTSSQTPQQTSSIVYFGERSYTLDKIQDMLQFPVTNITRQPIADIVITLGEDSRNTSTF